ncbi:Aste57867_21375 [Aphanomyces stellatus]|uniref:Carboxypeptidase n=1 Tax=Aphanomyces stellatus TaxID=120398 RepID=A0A485LI20_9STRA|nr:hypothetical protein As57867_021306 [Aphanomyces stellatus]VFT98047.1 Aste57867_21375 [Aphanomyces stellatus]
MRAFAMLWALCVILCALLPSTDCLRVSMSSNTSTSLPSICGEPEPHYTGFLNSLFYVFYETRAVEKSHAPLVIWLSGGPGCSGLVAMLFENGPCSVGEDPAARAKLNAASWTTVANMVYIDQPHGTGFSPARNANAEWRESTAMQDLIGFVDAFYIKYPTFATKDLYIFGESYAGHYIPDLAYGLVTRPTATSSTAGAIAANLKGVGIGNGLTSAKAVMSTVGEFGATTSHGAFLSASKETIQSCKDAIDACQATGGGNCDPSDQCDVVESYLLKQTKDAGRNYYDIRATCHTDDAFHLCYRFQPLYSFVNAPTTIAALGMTGHAWTLCNMDVFNHRSRPDYYAESEVKVAALLDRGVRVLVYAGDQDMVCNWMAQDLWTRELPWTSHAAFDAQPIVPYVVGGRSAGEIRHAAGLTFLRVYQSGHMVPFDQPDVALDMFHKFLQALAPFILPFVRAQAPLETVDRMHWTARCALLLAAVYVCTDSSIFYALEADNDPSLCGEPEPRHTGFLNGLYYIFYETRAKVLPETVPLVVWLSGGPGCSSLVGMLFENGPCSVGEETPATATLNPHSWTNAAHMVYIDQPRGTGFSPARASSPDWDASSSTDDLVQFLCDFYDKYPAFAANDLYIFGESYAGHFVPDLAAAILNPASVAASSRQLQALRVNLKGIGIGNGLTSAEAVYETIGPYAVSTNASFVPASQQIVDACEAAIQDCQDRRVGGHDDCSKLNICDDYMADIQAQVIKAGRNPYNIDAKCATSDMFGLCYRFQPLYSFVNSYAVMTKLGMTGHSWTLCSSAVYASHLDKDWFAESEYKVATLLENNIRVLVFAGDRDIVCNWMAQDLWTRTMVWPGQAGFDAQPFQPYTLHGTQLGDVRSFDGLTFFRIFHSGHMVPLDQPAVALDMFHKFLTNKPLAPS